MPHLNFNFLPDICVQSITLTTLNHSLEKKDDPHIEDDLEITQTNTPFGSSRSQIFSAVINQSLENKAAQNFTSKRLANIREDILRSSSKDNLEMKVDLVLCMKDTLSKKNGISQWFDRDLLKKYLKIRVIQSRSPETTRALIENRNLFDEEHYKSLAADGKIAYNPFSIEKNDPPTQSWQQRANDGFNTKKNIMPKQYLRETFSVNPEFLDDSGAIDITYRHSFVLKDPEPNHLVYFVSTFFDVLALETDYEIDLQSKEFRRFSSKQAIEFVFDRGLLVSETFIFFDKNGVIWTGPVIFDGVNYSKIDTNEILFYKKVPNAVIQDFRDLNDIKKLDFDFNFVQEELSKNITKNLSLAQNSTFSRRNTYFTDAFMARDSDGNARFAFAIDIKRLLISEGQFGNFLETENQTRIDEILERSRIAELKIFRKRVKNNLNCNDLGVCVETSDDFNSDFPVYEYVISSGERTNNNFIEKGLMADLDKDGVDDTKTGHIRELELRFKNGEHRNMRHFTVMDDYMSHITDGLYKYVINLTVEDGTISFIEEQINRLETIKKVLQGYYGEATIPDHFNLSTNLFNKKFKDKMRSRFEGRLNNAPWNFATYEFNSVMLLLFDDFDTAKYQILYDLTVPESGSPTGIILFGNVVDSIMQKLSSMLTMSGGSSNRSSTYIQKRDVRRSSNPLGNFIIIEKILDGIVDSNIPKGSGIDFLGLFHEKKNSIVLSKKTFIASDGLARISGGSYEQRVRDETLKYYNTEEVNSSLITDYKNYSSGDSIHQTSWSYLSPHSLSLENNESIEIIGEGNEWIASQYNKYVSLSHQSKNGGSTQNSVSSNTTSGNPEQQSVSNALLPIVESYGVTIVDEEVEVDSTGITVGGNKLSFLDVFGKDFSYTTADITQSDLQALEKNISNDTENYNSLLTSVVTDITAGAVQQNLSQTNIREAEEKKSFSFFNLKTSNNALDIKKFSSEDIQGLPNQIKSLFLAGLNSKDVKLNPFVQITNDGFKEVLQRNFTNDMMFKFNYELLAQVEILVGYGSSIDRKYNIKAPRWELLTLELYNESVGAELICRTKEYKSPLINDLFFDELKIPVYNRFFIIKPERIVKKELVNQNSPQNVRLMSEADLKELARANMNSGVFTTIYTQNNAGLVAAQEIEDKETEEIISSLQNKQDGMDAIRSALK